MNEPTHKVPEAYLREIADSLPEDCRGLTNEQLKAKMLEAWDRVEAKLPPDQRGEDPIPRYVLESEKEAFDRDMRITLALHERGHWEEQEHLDDC